MFLIDEINLMDAISSLEECVGKKFNISVFNVSHWDSSVAFQNKMAQVLSLPQAALPWNYCYSYSISEQVRQQVLMNLGIPSKQLPETMALLIQSSTIAIINIVNLLVHSQKKRLCILQPSYFSVAACCAAFSLDFGMEEITFRNGRPQLPTNEILAGGYDCVWITSPVYCTGRYFDAALTEEILRLKDSGLMIITDESLALPGEELLRTIPVDPNILAIYSPHKAISVNGLKFSVIACSKYYEEFLDQWLDVLAGSLSGSNRDAVFHYISPNYLTGCVPTYKAYIEERKRDIQQVIENFPFASMLPDTHGHYINIFTGLQFRTPKNLMGLLQEMICESMVSFFPGTLNGFSPAQGLNFRVNLTGDPVALPDAVGKILAYLEKYYHIHSETVID